MRIRFFSALGTPHLSEYLWKQTAPCPMSFRATRPSIKRSRYLCAGVWGRSEGQLHSADRQKTSSCAVSPARCRCCCCSCARKAPRPSTTCAWGPRPASICRSPTSKRTPDPEHDPREQDLSEKTLRKKLGSNFDPSFMSIHLPTQLNASAPPELPRLPMSADLKKLNLTETPYGRRVKVGKKARRKFLQWLWMYTHCPVLYTWKDLGVRFWPRYIKEGNCFSERSCSFPRACHASRSSRWPRPSCGGTARASCGRSTARGYRCSTPSSPSASAPAEQRERGAIDWEWLHCLPTDRDVCAT